MPIQNTDEAQAQLLRWLAAGGAGAMLMSLLTDVVQERGGTFMTRLARAVLNAVMAVGVALVLIRFVELNVAELLVLSMVFGSLGREYALLWIHKLIERWTKGPPRPPKNPPA